MLALSLVGGVLAFALGGCSRGAAPAVTVTSARVVERTSDGVTLNIELTAENQSRDPQPLREVRYDVRLADGSTFSGVREAQVSLKGFGVQTFVLPASFGGDHGDGPLKFEIAGEVEFLPAGVFSQTLIDSGVPYPASSFSGSGEANPATNVR